MAQTLTSDVYDPEILTDYVTAQFYTATPLIMSGAVERGVVDGAGEVEGDVHEGAWLVARYGLWVLRPGEQVSEENVFIVGVEHPPDQRVVIGEERRGDDLAVPVGVQHHGRLPVLHAGEQHQRLVGPRGEEAVDAEIKRPVIGEPREDGVVYAHRHGVALTALILDPAKPVHHSR